MSRKKGSTGVTRGILRPVRAGNQSPRRRKSWLAITSTWQALASTNRATVAGSAHRRESPGPGASASSALPAINETSRSRQHRNFTRPAPSAPSASRSGRCGGARREAMGGLNLLRCHGVLNALVMNAQGMAPLQIAASGGAGASSTITIPSLAAGTGT